MFPREDGHCHTHHVPGSIRDVDLDPEDYDEEFGEEFYQGTAFETALAWLMKKKHDVRRGDLIIFDKDAGYRNQGVAIFNGTKIVHLYYEIDDYGSLPEEFRVIEEGVPITYWADISATKNTPAWYGIQHNDIVWFDHKLVLKECLRNLQYGKVDKDKYGIFTTFVFGNGLYYIIFDYTNQLAEAPSFNHENCSIDDHNVVQFCIDVYRKMLLHDELFSFELTSDSYESDDGTLFVKEFNDF